ncbi:MAG: HAMP domain-containing histidine kinase [Bacteroidia bacterium]|nr:HAMP domain-containing histidine kinase [Bacteroidia bacterium]
MRLQIKLALYNAISKALIIVGIGILMPSIVEKVVYNHIEKRLDARLEKMLLMVQKGGLDEITLDQDCSWDSYNVFKEEYVSIYPLDKMPDDFGARHIENTERVIENEVVKHRVLSQAFIYDNQIYKIEVGEGLSTVDQMNQTLRNFMIRILVIVILISIFLDLGFARILLRPFNKIVNQKLKTIKHPANFKGEQIKSTTYEFEYLDKSINEMMQKIKETFQAEREFITNVSHEILTPISILRNRIENMINEPGVPADVMARLADSQKTLARLTRVVKALLQISKIENDQYVKNDKVSVRTLVEEVLAELSEWQEERQIGIQREWECDFDFSPCNMTLLHTLFFNIISNAIKYSHENSSIFISGRKTEQGYSLSIRDTGIGIKPEHLPYIFDRFKRFRPEDEMSYGLGLPIVKSIASFHGLQVSVKSVWGEGSEFIVVFPEAV